MSNKNIDKSIDKYLDEAFEKNKASRESGIPSTNKKSNRKTTDDFYFGNTKDGQKNAKKENTSAPQTKVNNTEEFKGSKKKSSNKFIEELTNDSEHKEIFSNENRKGNKSKESAFSYLNFLGSVKNNKPVEGEFFSKESSKKNIIGKTMEINKIKKQDKVERNIYLDFKKDSLVFNSKDRNGKKDSAPSYNYLSELMNNTKSDKKNKSKNESTFSKREETSTTEKKDVVYEGSGLNLTQESAILNAKDREGNITKTGMFAYLPLIMKGSKREANNEQIVTNNEIEEQLQKKSENNKNVTKLEAETMLIDKFNNIEEKISQKSEPIPETKKENYNETLDLDLFKKINHKKNAESSPMDHLSTSETVDVNAGIGNIDGASLSTNDLESILESDMGSRKDPIFQNKSTYLKSIEDKKKYIKEYNKRSLSSFIKFIVLNILTIFSYSVYRRRRYEYLTRIMLLESLYVHKGDLSQKYKEMYLVNPNKRPTLGIEFALSFIFKLKWIPFLHRNSFRIDNDMIIAELVKVNFKS